MHSRRIDDEYVVVNGAEGTAHCLAADSAAVWAVAGTGQRPAGITDERATQAVAELTDLGLLTADGVSRRSLLKRAGALGAGVTVASIALPMASAAASVAPTAHITPTSGPKGTVVTLTGSGFAPNKLIQVTVGGFTAVVSPAAVSTDGSGNIPAGVTFVVPDTGVNLGAQAVVVVVNGVSTSAGNFTISTPSVSLSNTSFVHNTSPQSVTVTGSGFFPGAVVTITNTGTDTFTPTPTTFTANGSGNISGSVSLVFANGAGRTGTLKFTDPKGNTASVNVVTT